MLAFLHGSDKTVFAFTCLTQDQTSIHNEWSYVPRKMLVTIIEAAMQENWPSGFPTKSNTNQPVHPQKKARIFIFWV